MNNPWNTGLRAVFGRSRTHRHVNHRHRLRYLDESRMRREMDHL